MELMLALPWLLGAGLLFALFDNDGGNSGGSNIVTPPPPDGFPEDATLLGSGNNAFIGTPGVDVVNGQGGSDAINGAGGDDLLLGGFGNDNVSGGAGDDIVIGGHGFDDLNGNTGDDIMLGQNGDDAMYGKAGEDTMFGGNGADRMFGADGEDLVIGDRGEDFVRGGAGNDIISGNLLFQGILNGSDAVEIRDTNNINDVSDIARMGEITQRDDGKFDDLYGDVGNDTLYIGDKDIASGGFGADTFYVSTESSGTDAATIRDFNVGSDSLFIEVDGSNLGPNPAQPIATIVDDGNGNARIVVGNEIVAIVNGQAATMTPADVMFKFV